MGALLPWEHLCEKVSLRMFSNGTPLFLAIQVSFSTHKLVTFILESPLHPLRRSRTCSGSKRKLEDFLMALVQFSPCPVTSANRDSTKKWRLFSMQNADVFPAVACLRRRPETTGNSSAFACYGTFETAAISAENFQEPYPVTGGVLPIMVYMRRLRPKRVPFSGFRYLKG